LLDCTASDFRNMNGKQLKQSIKASEGRVIVSEIIGAFAPLYPAVTNAEIAAAFDADLLLLNFFDVFAPHFAIPENIMTYSIAIRGKRHTYIRMASSPLR
jgi:hypothetical protein